ncbi:hypothetical protein [Haloterrigena salinisoli]|uniref:hypothetical protein n=1 Tax=Haloterrigena salinisoli TaxID=3132747 RepID=UPI0030CB3C4E
MVDLEDVRPPRVTKTALYRVVGWGLRCYVATVPLVGCDSVRWVLDVAGLVPGAWLSTVWIAIAVTGALFLVPSLPLFYASRSSTR